MRRAYTRSAVFLAIAGRIGTASFEMMCDRLSKVIRVSPKHLPIDFSPVPTSTDIENENRNKVSILLRATTDSRLTIWFPTTKNIIGPTKKPIGTETTTISVGTVAWRGQPMTQKSRSLRRKQIKNLFAINLLALGTPMILMGDEVRRTQCGNNNAYCHDSELTWLDWSLFAKHPDIYRFVRHLIHFRQSLPVREDQLMSLTELIHRTQIEWHGLRLSQPDWSSSSRTLSFSIAGKRDRLQVMLNGFWEAREFEIPILKGKKVGPWRRIIDTSLESPDDFCAPAKAPFVTTATYCMQPRSLVLLSTNFAQRLGIGKSI
jgi:pullulanase/glycogen debranching enzyme